MMAAGGELDGVCVLSSEIVNQWSQVASRLPDIAFAELPSNLITKQLAKTPQPRTIGHIGNMSMLGLGQRFGPNPNAYGAEGLGGQFGFCDPRANIAVGYVRSELAFLDVLQPALTNELYTCAQALGVEVTVDRRSSVRRLGDAAIATYARRRLAVPTMSA